MATIYAARPEDLVRTNRRHYFRQREYQLEDGTSVRARETRYSWGDGIRRTVGPRGGKRYQRYHHAAYYQGGKFYRVKSVRDESGEWRRVLSPITGQLVDVYPEQTSREDLAHISITVRDGVAVAISGDLDLKDDTGATTTAALYWAGLGDGGEN